MIAAFREELDIQLQDLSTCLLHAFMKADACCFDLDLYHDGRQIKEPNYLHCRMHANRKHLQAKPSYRHLSTVHDSCSLCITAPLYDVTQSISQTRECSTDTDYISTRLYTIGLYMITQSGHSPPAPCMQHERQLSSVTKGMVFRNVTLT